MSLAMVLSLIAVPQETVTENIYIILGISKMLAKDKIEIINFLNFYIVKPHLNQDLAKDENMDYKFSK